MTQPAATPIHVHWLVRLRWAAIVAQIVSIAGVKFLLRAPFYLAPLLVIVGLLVVANLALGAWLRRGRTLSEAAITANLLLDVTALTALLIWTGGAMNPFTTLYLLHVALAGVLVSRRFSLAVTLGAVVAFGGLLLARPEAIHVWHSGSMFMLHVRGMWLAFALTAACLWFFVERVSAALRHRDQELATARLDAMRGERLASLGALAAGTAHELNTPLGTVAILAAELAEQLQADTPERAYADKIRTELRRCTQILTKMRSYEATPEPLRSVDAGAWLRDTVAAWSAQHDDLAVPVRIETGAGATASIRADALRQALHSLLDNAWLATQPARDGISVRLADGANGALSICVSDRGVGIAPALIPRLGEPFFTTREPGHGLGLGLFLAQAAVSQLGGRLSIQSGDGETRVEMTIPRGDGPSRTS